MADVPLTHARVLRIALPIVLSNATVPLLGAVDTGVVGQLGLAAPIGAVGLGAVVLASVYWIFGFLRMGTSGLAAQARGAGEVAEGGAILLRSLMIGAAAGMVLVVLQGPLIWLAFRIAPASAEVEDLTRTYLAIRIWGAPATICMYAVTGWLIAQERTRAVLVVQLGINLMNIGLDLLFVLRLGWGVPGVAVASLLAEWTGLTAGLWFCRAVFARGAWRNWAQLLEGARLRRMLLVNSDIMIRSVVLQFSFTAFVFLGAGFGTLTLAANQVLLQFLQFTAFGLDGFAFAAEALVGLAIGAGSVGVVRRSAVMTSQWGVGGAVTLALVFWIWGPGLIDLLTNAPDVRLAARAYLPWVMVAPVIGIASWMLDGIFIGATQTRDMRNAMLQSVLIYLGALWVLTPWLGNHGLWAALMVLNATRAITLARLYPRIEARAGLA